MRAVLAACLMSAALFTAPLSHAQGASEAASGLPQSEILVVDSEQLFAQSSFGQRVAQELAAEESVLLAENRQIQAKLTEEERVLTEQRATMDAKAFRAIAEAFDARVVQIRNQQDAKSVNIEQKRKREEDAFVRAASPILTALMQEAGASIVMERRAVLMFDPAVDITPFAIERLNLVLGDGAVAPAEEQADQ
ncbi:chaperone for outer membrane proteins, Skp family [Shimia marina]|uniref:Outer membrane protein n=2 Tax=Shimia marina TaxID=321267 RepID=A0A0P1ESW1_9RHOB|nr:Outer membrane protein [Shimia marina]SFE43606.1 chaperone for outer membrane proteins, Skp family [Shimia marina]